ncbi:MAG: hypothetical protein FWF92_03220 [Oscillospiraceae bacterium]|nr:hypothetical protein [Oscillospiraceae bacterium]
MKKQLLFVFVIFLLICCLPFIFSSCDSNNQNENTEKTENKNDDDRQDESQDEEPDQPEPELNKDNVPEMDLGGYNFRILSHHSDWLHAEMNFEEQTGDIIQDSIYHRNRKIEERFNILITEINDVSKAKPAILAGSDEYDIVTAWCATMLTHYNEGLGYNFDDYNLYIDLTQPYWDDSITQALTFGGTVLFPIGASDIPSYDYTHVLLFNKQMITDLELENPYIIVAGGNWTFDKFEEMAKAAVKDMNGDGIMDQNDRYGLVSMVKYVLPCFWVSAGTESISKSNDGIPQFTLRSDEKFAGVIDKIFSMTYDTNVWYQDVKNDTNISETGDALVINNQALFFNSTFQRVEALRGMDTDFGIIPYPKYNTDQDKYYTRMEGCNPFIIPITVENPENIGAIMEALSCESFNSVIPVYYDVSLKTKLARDEESAEMLDIIFSDRVFDLGDTIWCGLLRDGIFLNMFKKNDRNLASQLEKVENRINKEIDTVIKALGMD